MSLWHWPQASESMKKFDGIMPPTLVLAEEGKSVDFAELPAGVRQKRDQRECGGNDVCPESPAVFGNVAADGDVYAEYRGEEEETPGCGEAAHDENQHPGQHQPKQQVQERVEHVEDRGRCVCRHVRSIQQQRQK